MFGSERPVRWQYTNQPVSTPALYQQALRRGEACVAFDDLELPISSVQLETLRCLTPADRDRERMRPQPVRFLEAIRSCGSWRPLG